MKIEGFFGSPKKAQDAVNKLKQSGFQDAYFDANTHYIDDLNVQTNLPGAEPAPSLSGLVIKGGDPVLERDKAPLLTNSPMVSGMAGFEEIADYGVKLIVDVEESKAPEVKHIINTMGGELYNPNVDRPDYPDDIL